MGVVSMQDVPKILFYLGFMYYPFKLKDIFLCLVVSLLNGAYHHMKHFPDL